ncbi:HNH endonuclease [Bacillus sp. WC2507]|uniref:HNH endonuclease n=1 Tax=Bacillus sp. WC2507 TaxID=3461404 RepID=UPI0040435A45
MSRHTKICGGCGKRVDYNATCSCMKRKRTNKKLNETDKLLKSTRWKKKRIVIIHRDGVVCQRCLIKYNIINSEKLEVHHIKPRSKYPELMFEDTNLITLCKTCNLQIGTREELDFKCNVPDENELIL